MQESFSNRRIVKNTALLYIRMVIVMVVNLYTSRLVLQALGVDDYGLFNVVGGIILIFAIVNSALGSGTSRFITFELGKGNLTRLRNTFSTAFIIHAVIALFVFLLAETIGIWYVNNVLVMPENRVVAANWLFQFSIVTCMFSLTQVPYYADIVAHEDMKTFAWIGVCEAVFKMCFVLVLVYTDGYDKLIVYGAILMAWSICVQLFYRYYCNRHYEESRLCWVRDKSYYRAMLKFSLWDVMGNFTVQGHSQGISLMMNYFFSLAVNAAKGVSFQVRTVVNQFAGNFMTAVGPQIVKLYAEGNIEKMRKLVSESSKISFYLLLFVALPLSIEANYVLKLWLGLVPEKTSIFLQLGLVVILQRAFATPVVHAVHATGNIKQLNLYSGGTSILLNLPLTYIAYLAGAPAESTFFIQIGIICICNYIELWCLRREVGFSILRYTFDVYFRGVVVALPPLVVAIAVHWLMPESFLRLVLVVFATTFLIAITAFAYGISSSTRLEVINMIKSKIKK